MLGTVSICPWLRDAREVRTRAEAVDAQDLAFEQCADQVLPQLVHIQGGRTAPVHAYPEPVEHDVHPGSCTACEEVREYPESRVERSHGYVAGRRCIEQFVCGEAEPARVDARGEVKSDGEVARREIVGVCPPIEYTRIADVMNAKSEGRDASDMESVSSDGSVEDV